jgi:hypothetical protein
MHLGRSAFFLKKQIQAISEPAIIGDFALTIN